MNNRKTIFMLNLTCILCFILAGLAVADESGGAKYYIGEVVGLDSVKNTMTITEYNSATQKKFGLGRTGLPEDVFMGDEVVVVADKDNTVKDIRLLSEKNNIEPGGAMQLPPGRRTRVNESLGGIDPFYDLARMQEQMSRMFQDSLQTGGLDQGLFNSDLSFNKDFKLEDTGREYILKLDMAGLDKDSIKIEMDKNSITLKGRNLVKTQQNTDTGSYRYESFGSFLKTIPLPPDADTRNMQTKLDGNIMVIRMPKIDI